jgi:hypothetical protein
MKIILIRMRTLSLIVAAITIMSLCSCSKVIYPQDQVLAGYRTMDDVKKQFGIPAEKMTDTAEHWLYIFERSAPRRGQQSKYSVVKTASTKNVDNFTLYQRVVIFSFDKDGKVIRRDVRGVDLSKRKFSAGKTIALVLGIAGAVVIVGVIVANNLSFSYY